MRKFEKQNDCPYYMIRIRAILEENCSENEELIPDEPELLKYTEM